MKTTDLFAWLTLLVLSVALVYSPGARSETIAATAATVYGGSSANSTIYDSACLPARYPDIASAKAGVAACDRGLHPGGAETGGDESTVYTCNGGSANPATCTPGNGQSCGRKLVYYSAPGHSFCYDIKAYSGYSCPSNQNWTLSGSNCTRPDCGPGDVRDPATGVCQSACVSKAGTTASSGNWDLGVNKASTAAIPNLSCFSGCYAAFSSTGNCPSSSALVAGVTHYYCAGSYKFLPFTSSAFNACSTQAENTGSTVPSDSCGAGQVLGQVNGKTVCVTEATHEVAAVKSDPVPVTSTSTTSTTDPVTNNVTTTTTTTNPDKSVTTKTTITGPDGKEIGSTTTGKSDTGTDQCEKYPDSAGCQDLGDPSSDTTALETQNRTFTVTPVTVGGAGACPPDKVVHVSGHSISIPYGHMCDFAFWLRPLILACAWLGAAFIVAGSIRGEV